jgi:hypothetical protein
MSAEVPPNPPDGWCNSTLAFGVMYRLPFVPDESRNCPIEAAMPMPTVTMSFGTNFIVS